MKMQPTPDIEVIIENDLARAAELSRQGRGIGWELAGIAARIVGQYTPATAALASACGVTVDAVQHWANAWNLIESLDGQTSHSADGIKLAAADLRDSLTVSHAAKMHRLTTKYDLKPREQMFHLARAVVASEGRCLSVRDMEAEVEASHNWRTVDWRRWHLPRLESLVGQLLTFGDELDAALREWLVSYPKGENN